MTDCLASTGAEPLIPLGIGVILVVAGLTAAVLLRRQGRYESTDALGSANGAKPGRGRAGRGSASLGLLLLLSVGVGASSVAGAAPARVATAPSIQSPLSAPSASSSQPSAMTASAHRATAPITAAHGCVALPSSTTAPTPTPTQPPAKATILPDLPVSFVSNGVTTDGSYRGPADTSRSVAAAVIIGGTGAVDRNGDGAGIVMQEYSWLADLLSAQGIASIRYDKLGTGETGLGPYTDNPAAMLPLDYDQLRIQPARDALSFLAAQPGVDATRLILVGHSEGGAAALIIASDPGSAPAPAGLALVEPAYTHILDIVSRQFETQLTGAAAAGAMTVADAATLAAWMHAGIAEIRIGTAPFPAPGPVPLPGATGFTQVIQSVIDSNVYGTDPTQMVITHAYRTLYGQGYDETDPAAIAPTIAIPTLVTCGTKDFNTPCGDGTAGSGVIALSTAFAHGVAHFVQLPNTVHILRDVGDADVPNIADQVKYPFSTALASEFAGFMARFATTAQ